MKVRFVTAPAAGTRLASYDEIVRAADPSPPEEPQENPKNLPPWATPGLRQLVGSLIPGERVSVRYRIDDPQAAFSDALGEVSAQDGERIVVRTRNGAVAIPISTVVAARRVPPASKHPRQRS